MSFCWINIIVCIVFITFNVYGYEISKCYGQNGESNNLNDIGQFELKSGNDNDCPNNDSCLWLTNNGTVSAEYKFIDVINFRLQIDWRVNDAYDMNSNTEITYNCHDGFGERVGLEISQNAGNVLPPYDPRINDGFNLNSSCNEASSIYIKIKQTAIFVANASELISRYFYFENICIYGEATTFMPTIEPTLPTLSPVNEPTLIPSLIPTIVPTEHTKLPTFMPTLSPFIQSTNIGTRTSSLLPTLVPTETPTLSPTIEPTLIPSRIPTNITSLLPTHVPTQVPSILPLSNVSNNFKREYLPWIIAGLTGTCAVIISCILIYYCIYVNILKISRTHIDDKTPIESNISSDINNASLKSPSVNVEFPIISTKENPVKQNENNTEDSNSIELLYNTSTHTETNTETNRKDDIHYNGEMSIMSLPISPNNINTSEGIITINCNDINDDINFSIEYEDVSQIL